MFQPGLTLVILLQDDTTLPSVAMSYCRDSCGEVWSGVVGSTPCLDLGVYVALETLVGFLQCAFL